MPSPEVQAFFDDSTNTISYVVSDPASGHCAVVDSVLGFDSSSGRTDTIAADAIIEYINGNSLDLRFILETHVHADHLTAAPHLQAQLGGQIGIGACIAEVQEVFTEVFNLRDVPADGSQFDILLNEGDEVRLGELNLRVLHTPGHTPACCTYVIGDAAFVGDTLFMPDFGTARCDFPGGDAGVLYDSIQRIFALPSETRLFMCHDYKAPGRDEFAWETTVARERSENVHLNDQVSREAFVEFRGGRDSNLDMPKLILPAIQVNIRAGRMPSPEDNGVCYLKTPLNRL